MLQMLVVLFGNNVLHLRNVVCSQLVSVSVARGAPLHYGTDEGFSTPKMIFVTQPKGREI